MIETSLSRVKIHEVIQSQIPEYIDFENPLFGEFLKQYYYSQEFQGGPVDIAENLTEYKSLDFLNTENLTGFTSVSSYVNSVDTTIYVDSTQGFPNQWGLFKINDEIITYTGIGSTSFTGCVRGFSGIEKNAKTNKPEHLTFSVTGVGTHAAEARVTNLSNVFLNQFLKKLKTQILPGFQERVLTGNLDQSNFIRQAKDFYKSKGTEEAFKILFGALYGEKVEMVQPQEFLFRPSDAEYTVNDVLVCEVISGDPKKLVSQTITQGNASGSVYAVESVVLNNRTYYKLRLSTDTMVGNFVPTNRTYTVKQLGIGATVVYVDSTVGFAKSSSLSFDSTTLDYTDKTITEFLNVTGITENIGIGQTVSQGTTAISYEDGDLDSPVTLRILNSITKLESTGVNQESGSIVNIKTLGREEYDKRFESWIQNSVVKNSILTFGLIGPNSYRITLFEDSFYNKTDEIEVIDADGNILDGSVTNIVDSITLDINCPTLTVGTKYFIRTKLKLGKEFTANVQNTYSDGQTVVVASNSIPHWDIDVKKRLRTFNATNTITYPDHNYVSGEIVVYDGTAVGLETGRSYYVKRLGGNQFKLALSAENARRDQFVEFSGSGTLTPFQVGFSTIGAQKLLRRFDLPELGDAKDATEGGVGLFLNGVEAQSYKSSDKVYYGSLQNVTVLNSGSGYDVINPPRLSIQQTGHIGAGASVVAQVHGPITEFLVDTEGLDYTSRPDVKVTGGNGECIAEAKMKLAPHEVSFDSTTVGGIVNTTTNQFVFPTAHGFKSGEEVIYSTDGTTTIGIGTAPGNLVRESSYNIVKVDDYTISLASNRSDGLLGVGTISITSSGGGVHKFSTKIPRLKVDKVNVISSTDFFNREVKIDSVNTYTDTIVAPGHRYSSGDKIRLAGTVGGLTNGTDYYAIKINENEFRVSISTSLTSFVNLTSFSSGSFNYPPIVVEIKGQQGISTADATATPIVRGSVDGVYVTENGAGFGSLVINDNFKPDVRVIEGSQATMVPVIINGRIDSISIKSGGKDFFSVPDIIIAGDGVGAKLKARVSGGKIVGVDVIDPGANYTRNGTTLTASTPGEGLISSANLKEWTINNVARYAKFGDVGEDDGFYGELKDSDNGYPYVNYYASRNLREYLGDDGTSHSPILGYAYDGNPIYGPYALKNGVLKYMESSYAKLSGNRSDGPPLTEYDAGFFVEDFTYQVGLGDLDEHNGRFAATPEYPNGVYAYYVTESSTVVSNTNSPFANRREPLFPYIIGHTYHAKVNDYNLAFTSTQDTMSSSLVRNTAKQNIREYEFVSPNAKGKFNSSTIELVSKGSVENVSIINPGRNYNIGDSLVFDNSGTQGFGAAAKVSEVVGAAITVITSTVNIDERVELFAEGSIVTGIVTTGLHDYPDGIPLKISGISSSIYSGLEGTFNIKVDRVTSGLGTSLLATGLTTSIGLIEDVSKFQEEDILKVDDEQLKVLSVDVLNQKITLLRAVNGTVGAAHTNRAEVVRLEDKFTYQLDNPLDVETPRNFVRFFDATNSVGVGLTAGVGIGTTVSYTGAGNQSVDINLPIKSIRIPNHGFRHGDPVNYHDGGGSHLLYSYDGTNTQFIPDTGLFVQKISNDLIGIVTQAYQISNQHDRVFFNGTIGIGNSHSFRTARSVPTANATTFETIVSTATTHHLVLGDVIDLTLVSAASSTINVEYDAATRFVSVGSSDNPPIYVTKGDQLIFDTSDFDLADTRLEFYEDQNFVKRFVGSGKSTIEIVDNLIPGITSARTTVHFTENMPEVLYYKFTSTSPTKVVEVNKDVVDYGKIIVNNSVFSGKHTLTTSTGQEFRYYTAGAPERVGYTSESSIRYTTTANVPGPVSKVLLQEGGRNYRRLPKASVGSTTGSSAVLLVESDSIAKQEKTRILEFGYDYPSDYTLRPEASVPDVIVLRDNFSLGSVAITSTGSNYLTPPDLIVYNESSNTKNDSVEMVATLSGSSVDAVRIVSGGGNLTSSDNRILAINNTNGVGIVSATYSDPNVTLRLKTPPGGFTTATPLPFAIGDEIFVENIGVSSGNGYNSEDFNYQYFTLSGVNTAPGLVNQATLTYAVDKNPGFHDTLGFGIVTKKQNIAQFEATLKEGVFFAGEEVYTPNATTKIIAGKDSSTNIIRVESLVGINTGDKITGKSSGASGIVNGMVENSGHFETGALFNKAFGWEKDTGKTSEFFQRVQDNDYYQRFAYSLKSKVGISSWSEPVDSLAHIAGFKKHSDLLIPSDASVGVGTTTVSVLGGASASIILLDNKADVNCKYQWDAVRELTDVNQTKSDEVVFRGNQFGEALICKTNRVLDIDDISPQFYSDPDLNRSVVLDVWQSTSVSAVKYYAQIVLDATAGQLVNETQYTEFVVSHNQQTALINSFSDLSDSFDLGDFTADMDVTGEVTVSFEPYNSSFVYDITFYKEVLQAGVGVGTTSYTNIEKSGVSSYSASATEQVIQSFSANEFRSGTILVSVASPNEKEFLEASFVGVASGSLGTRPKLNYIEYGKFKEDMDLGTFSVGIAGTDEVQVKFTPAAGLGVTISTLVTKVGIATTVGSIPGVYSVGDAALYGSRTDIPASATPSATNVSNNTYQNYTSVKYFVEIENTTNNDYSSFHLAANMYEGDVNYNKYGNVSTAQTARRDIENTEIVVSAPNVFVQFTPMENRDYVVRVSEIRIDKPDDVASDTLTTLP